MKTKTSTLTYENSCEFLFNMISQRLRARKYILKKKNKDIYPNDENLISTIAHNRRNERKNKYLIPAETSRSSERKNYIPIITNNLEFDSVQEFLWGNVDEIKAYSGALFYWLIIDALEYENENIQSDIYELLMDYIPFAKAKFSMDFYFEHGDTARILINEKYLISENDYFEIQSFAIGRLYSQIEYCFTQSLINFLYKRENTLKLDKALSSFVKDSLLPLCKSDLILNPIGQEAIGLLYKSYNQYINNFNYELALSPEAAGYHENDLDYLTRQTIGEVLTENLKHVDKLLEIQEKHDEEHYELIIKNNWEVGMCI